MRRSAFPELTLAPRRASRRAVAYPKPDLSERDIVCQTHLSENARSSSDESDLSVQVTKLLVNIPSRKCRSHS